MITPEIIPSYPLPFRNPDHRELYYSGLRLALGEKDRGQAAGPSRPSLNWGRCFVDRIQPWSRPNDSFRTTRHWRASMRDRNPPGSCRVRKSRDFRQIRLPHLPRGGACFHTVWPYNPDIGLCHAKTGNWLSDKACDPQPAAMDNCRNCAFSRSKSTGFVMNSAAPQFARARRRRSPSSP